MAGLVSAQGNAGAQTGNQTGNYLSGERGAWNAGGPKQPARSLRPLPLAKNNKDTLYRIHGTNEPWTIGTNVSSGCIRLTNEDVTDLYDRVVVGSKVVVLS